MGNFDVDLVTLLRKFKYSLIHRYRTCSIHTYISDYIIHTSLYSQYIFLIIKPFNIIIFLQ